MKIKNIILLIILVTLTSIMASCGNGVKVVKEIPAGFVKLSTAGDTLDIGGLYYTLDESKILFFDSGKIIYQTALSNSDFIVFYNDEYYIDSNKYFELVHIVTAVKVVQSIPTGFVQLDKAAKNGPSYVFWETQISFVVADQKCIFQTAVYNDSFLVKYENEYYVNEKQFLEIVEMAKAAVGK